MDIHPIRTEEDHAKALTEIETLWGAGRDTPEGDKLDVMITLVDRYENEHYPIGPAHPIDVLKLHMEMTGRSQADLASLIGSASRASDVLNKRRALTLDMAHKLNKEWGLPVECLIIPYELDVRACTEAFPRRRRFGASLILSEKGPDCLGFPLDRRYRKSFLRACSPVGWWCRPL